MFNRNYHCSMILYWAIFSTVLLVEAPNGLKVASATNVSSSEECQQPWWPVSEVKCARFLREPLEQYYLPFKEASAVCHSLGEGHAHILTINSPAEQAAVESHLYAVNPSAFDGPNMVDSDFWVQVGGGGGDDDPDSYANYISEKEAKKEGRTVVTSGNNTCAAVLVDNGKWIRENCSKKHKIVCQKVLFGKAARLKKLKEERLEKRLAALELSIQQVLKGQNNQADKLKPQQTVPSTTNQSFEAPLEAKIAVSNEERMQVVKEMALGAWRASKEDRASGNEWLKARLVLGALSTLQVMGLQEEYTEARQWLEKKFHFEALNASLPVSEITSEAVGGLLSAYALSGGTREDRDFFLEKALAITRAISPAYNTTSRMPFNAFNPAARLGVGRETSLATVGGQALEQMYLSDLTGERTLRSAVTQTGVRLKVLKEADEGDGFYHNVIDVEADAVGAWSSAFASLGAQADDFYRALVGGFALNSAVVTGERLKTYAEALEELIGARAIRGNDTTGLGAVYEMYIPSKGFHNSRLMDYEVCYVGGLLALGAREIQKMASRRDISSLEGERAIFSVEMAARHRKLAAQIAETCYQASTRTATKLGPENFKLDDFKTRASNSCDLSPELAETHFLLWRLTGDVKYRERAWEMAQAIQQYARTPNGGFSSVSNVDDASTKDGKNEYTGTLPHFLSATFKYLYLTFAPIDVLPLDKWVFNAVGHPLPVCGQHSDAVYPTVKCRNE